MHFLDFCGYIISLLLIYIEHVLDNVADESLTVVDQGIVKLVALNQEHAHADFIRSLSLDLVDGVLVHLDAINIFFLIANFVFTELLDFFRLLHQEQVLIVDIDSLSSDL